MNVKIVDIEAIEKQWYKYYNIFDSEVKVWGILNNIDKEICLTMDFSEDVYTDNDENTPCINIGLSNPLIVECKDEKEFVLVIKYLIGHEIGHILHTSARSWMWGLKTGLKSFFVYMSTKYEGKTRCFKKDEDYDKFLKYLREKEKIYINLPLIKEFNHFICNAMEDGRIERKQMEISNNFKNQLLVSRNKSYNSAEFKLPHKEEDLTAIEKLQIILNQILSLSTSGLYMKNYADTVKEDGEVNTLLDSMLMDIGTSVTAKTTMTVMKKSLEIENKLYDLFLEAVKLDAEEVENMLGAIAKMFSTDAKGYDNLPKNFSPNEESDDETGEDISMNGFNIFDSSSDKKEEKDKGDEAKGKDVKEKLKDSAKSTPSEEDVKEAQESLDAVSEKEKSKIDSQKSVMEKPVKMNPTPPSLEKSEGKLYDPDVTFKELPREYKLNYPTPTDIQANAQKVKQELMQILRNQKSIETDLTRGDVCEDDLYKMILGETEFFEREIDEKEFDGVAYILQDNSGSMYGSKRELACRASTLIEEAFKELMPLKITSFTCSDNNVIHRCVKEFDEVQSNSNSFNFLKALDAECGNKDGYSIRIATKELLNRPEEKKIFVIISDGLPTDYNSTEINPAYDVQEAVRIARENGIIVVPIYISEYLDMNDSYNKEILDTYSKMYGKQFIACEPNKLADKLIDIFKAFYLNSK